MTLSDLLPSLQHTMGIKEIFSHFCARTPFLRRPLTFFPWKASGSAHGGASGAAGAIPDAVRRGLGQAVVPPVVVVAMLHGYMSPCVSHTMLTGLGAGTGARLEQ